MNDYIKREDAIAAFANYLGATFGAVSHRTARTVECILKPVPAAPVMERTQEAAIDYLRNIGWLQEHDRVLTETAQVRGVVKCGECIHLGIKDFATGYCKGGPMCGVVKPWDYCSHGVRKADMRAEEGGAT